MKKFRDFESARAFVRALKLKNQREWAQYCKSGNKPDDIPSLPWGTYKNKGYKGYGDWLGTGRIAERDRVFRSFDEAREFVRKLGFQNRDEWYQYCKSGSKPDDIPVNLNGTYKNNFKGWGDFLGTGKIAYQDREHVSFEDAQKFARNLGLKNREEWMMFCKSGEKPPNIPISPRNMYKGSFKGWGDFLGTGKIAYQDREYRLFEDAREFVNKLGLQSTQEWRTYCKSGSKPHDIPFFPEGTYKNEWEGMGDWLGTGNISPTEQSKKWLPLKEAKIEARKIVKKLGISSYTEWVNAHKKGKIPDFLPRYPYDIYGRKRNK